MDQVCDNMLAGWQALTHTSMAVLDEYGTFWNDHWQEKSEVLRENLLLYHFFYHKYKYTALGLQPQGQETSF